MSTICSITTIRLALPEISDRIFRGDRCLPHVDPFQQREESLAGDLCRKEVRMGSFQVATPRRGISDRRRLAAPRPDAASSDSNRGDVREVCRRDQALRRRRRPGERLSNYRRRQPLRDIHRRGRFVHGLRLKRAPCSRHRRSTNLRDCVLRRRLIHDESRRFLSML